MSDEATKPNGGSKDGEANVNGEANGKKGDANNKGNAKGREVPVEYVKDVNEDSGMRKFFKGLNLRVTSLVFKEKQYQTTIKIEDEAHRKKVLDSAEIDSIEKNGMKVKLRNSKDQLKTKTKPDKKAKPKAKPESPTVEKE